MRKILRAFLFLSTLASVSLSNVYAEDVEVTLSYHMEGIAAHKLKVTVNGPGILRDGDAEIRDGTNVYELREDAEKIFHIDPDEGSHLASVMIDGQEVRDTIDEQLTIKDLKEDREVMITFEKDEESKVPEDKETAKGNDGTGISDLPEGGRSDQAPQTGVVKRTGMFYLLVISSAGTICYVRYRKHEDEPEK